MKRSSEFVQKRGLLVFLFLACAALLFFAFLPTPRLAINSLEARYSEISMHGLKIIPASCVSGNTYYHANLSIAGQHAYSTFPGDSDAGAWIPGVGDYICVISHSGGQAYFIPAKTAAELQAFKAHQPSGVWAN